MRLISQDGPAEQAVAAPSQHAPDSQDVAQSGAQRRRGGHWEGKASIIDQLNELVGELRDIDSSIALHVRLPLTMHMLVQALFADDPAYLCLSQVTVSCMSMM
jgi:hypothetical protein